VRRGAIAGRVREEAQLRLFLFFTVCSMCEVGIVSLGGGVGELVLQSRTQQLLKLRVWCGARRRCGRAQVFATDAGVLSAQDTPQSARSSHHFALGGADMAQMAQTSRVHWSADIYQEKKTRHVKPVVIPGDRRWLSCRSVRKLDLYNMQRSPARSLATSSHRSESRSRHAPARQNCERELLRTCRVSQVGLCVLHHDAAPSHVCQRARSRGKRQKRRGETLPARVPLWGPVRISAAGFSIGSAQLAAATPLHARLGVLLGPIQLPQPPVMQPFGDIRRRAPCPRPFKCSSTPPPPHSL
jgi:hypothetical protein